MTIFTLYIWTIVGFAGAQYSSLERQWERQDWRQQGEFAGKEKCEEAARQLGLSRYKCIDTGRVK